MSTQVNVVTYNVLSSHLSSADYFTHCEPQFLKADYRLNELKKKLDEKINQKAVICLQEVSTLWSGKLQPFFQSRNYCLIDTHYGQKFNGNMGVAIAYPLDSYNLVDLDITCIADTKWFPRQKKLTVFGQIYTSCWQYVKDILDRIGILQKPEYPWSHALKRNNRMITARLAPKDEPSRRFVIGTYHMPCMFKLPAVMLIHCALSTQHLQKFASSDPYMYLGDFNIKPLSSMYQLLTSGKIESTHPDMSTLEKDLPFNFDVRPLRSAYVVKNGKEPEFTNNAQVKDGEPFVDTLDYIFLSEHWSVDRVDTLPSRAALPGPLPVKSEPSDHLLLAATVTY